MEDRTTEHDPLSLSGAAYGLTGAALGYIAPYQYVLPSALASLGTEINLSPTSLRDRIGRSIGGVSPKFHDLVDQSLEGLNKTPRVLVPSAMALSYLAGNRMTEEQRENLAIMASIPRVAPMSYNSANRLAGFASDMLNKSRPLKSKAWLPLDLAAKGLLELSIAAAPYVSVKTFNEIVHGDY